MRPAKGDRGQTPVSSSGNCGNLDHFSKRGDTGLTPVSPATKGKHMSLEKAQVYLRSRGYEDRIILTEKSSATVELAAAALGCEPGMIAKSLSLMTREGPVMILAEGTARIDNRKFKDCFHEKARMIPFDEVEACTGHAPGGVCPFGANEDVRVFLDESLRKYETVYPAAGNDHSGVRLKVGELESCLGYPQWVDVCK